MIIKGEDVNPADKKLIATHVDVATHRAIHLTARMTGSLAAAWLRDLIKEGLARDKPKIMVILSDDQKCLFEQALST